MYPMAFEIRPDTSPDWQVTFYRSLFEVDGIILVGGGRSTFVAGLIALTLEIPAAPLAMFGGQTQRVWDVLDRVKNDAMPEHLRAMAAAWEPDSAARNIDGLMSQRDRREQRQRQIEEAQAGKRRSTLAGLLAAIIFLVVGLAIIPLVFALEPATAGNLAALISAPLLVAPSGALVRNVLDGKEDWWQAAILGMIAGAVSGLLFILAQLAASPDLLSGEPARRLLLFVTAVGFVAGLTFDTVYTRLRTQDVVNMSGISGVQKKP
jgi:hypothetical protein